jgi:hypothetical protein
VQLEQFDIHLALNMAKMPRGGYLHAAIEEMQKQNMKTHAKVDTVKKWGVVILVYTKVKTAIERHPAMVRENQIHSYLPCQSDTAIIPRPCGRCKSTHAPAP